MRLERRMSIWERAHNQVYTKVLDKFFFHFTGTETGQ